MILRTGNTGKVFCTGAGFSGAGSILRLNATNAANTGTVLILDSDGMGGAHINFDGDGERARVSPVEGDLWYNENSNELNFYDGSDTTDLLAGGGGISGDVQTFTATGGSIWTSPV